MVVLRLDSTKFVENGRFLGIFFRHFVCLNVPWEANDYAHKTAAVCP